MTTVLAIDQSCDSSGWCVMVDGRIEYSGVARNAVERASAVDTAYRMAEARGLSLIAVLEDHRKMRISRGNASPASLQGMGAARGRWEQVLEMHGITDVRMVEPHVWRKAVLGLKRNVKRDDAKDAANVYAHALLGRAPESDDESEAIAMAAYAAREYQPKKTRKRKAVT